MTKISKKNIVLNWVPCIHYPFRFWKNTANVWALINLGSEVNAMTSAYIAKLSLKVWLIDIWAQKIDSSLPRTFKMVIASFQIYNKLDWACFF